MTSASLRQSLARFGSLCATLCVGAQPAWAQDAAPNDTASSLEAPPYVAWPGNAPPPPAIALGTPLAPELPAPEYARRPFELLPELLLGFPSCSEGSTNDTRCAGLGAGAGLGLAALWRVSPYFAFGGALEGLRFGFDPPGSSRLNDSSASGVFYGLLGRVYFADRGPVEPYVELGLGGGADRTNARESNAVTYSEAAAGAALRVGGGVELYLGRHVRLGPALDWTRFRVLRVQRCDATQACTELDPGENGHGVGFTTFALRLTILVGPGL